MLLVFLGVLLEGEYDLLGGFYCGVCHVWCSHVVHIMCSFDLPNLVNF